MTDYAVILLAAIAAFALLWIIALVFGSQLKISNYTVRSEAVKTSFRVALIADLHDSLYGKGQKELLNAIFESNPDLILMSGDIFSDTGSDAASEILLDSIGKHISCYCVTGNHEVQFGPEQYERKMTLLEKHGVRTLHNTWQTVTVNGNTVNICGIDDPVSFKPGNLYPSSSFTGVLKQLDNAVPKQNYSILLSHRPERFSLYAHTHFNLVLCGHAHGGQWRIPGVLNGVYAPHQGLFPKYTGGIYAENSTSMVVSRGLSKKSTIVPRIFNRPELVIIDIE